METFKKAHFKVWDLPMMKQRVQYCIAQARQFGLTLNEQQGKQYYNEMYNCEVWKNDLYEVRVFRNKQANWIIKDSSMQNKMDYLSIKRLDKKSIHDWRDLQNIKNELISKDREAIEIYPSEDRLIDTANQYHLFVFPKNYTIPFGWFVRKVDSEEKKGGFNIAGQRGING